MSARIMIVEYELTRTPPEGALTVTRLMGSCGESKTLSNMLTHVDAADL